MLSAIPDDYSAYVSALGLGLLIGIVRERQRDSQQKIAAGMRTHTLAALAFGGTYFFDPVPPGLPGLGAVEFPRLVCLLILALSGLLALQQGSPPSAEDSPPLDRGAWSVFAACALFLPAMEVLGIWGAAPVFLVLAGVFVVLGNVGLLLAYRLGRTATIAPFFYSFALWGVISGLVVWGTLPNALASTGIVLIVASGIAILLIDQRRDRVVAVTDAL